jgi:hypothetical protein
MPNDAPIQIAWMNFTKSVQILLVSQTDDRPLDQSVGELTQALRPEGFYDQEIRTECC